jgi:hypothetical protein
MEFANLNAKDKQRFQRAVEARNSPQQSMFAPAKDFAKLKEAGLVEINDQMKDAAGNVAVRASDAGLQAWNAAHGGAQGAQNPAGSVASTVKPEGKRARLEIDADVPMPTGSAVRAARESIYPFDALEIGKSFHVAKTEEMPNPEKALGSSVSAAKRKFSVPLAGTHKTRTGEVPNYTLTRNFKMVRVTKDDPRGEGIRVYRVDLPANPNVDGKKGSAKE